MRSYQCLLLGSALGTILFWRGVKLTAEQVERTDRLQRVADENKHCLVGILGRRDVVWHDKGLGQDEFGLSAARWPLPFIVLVDGPEVSEMGGLLVLPRCFCFFPLLRDGSTRLTILPEKLATNHPPKSDVVQGSSAKQSTRKCRCHYLL